MIENHDIFTFNIHVIPRGQRKFLDRALTINRNEKRPFCSIDYPDLQPATYRKNIQKSKKYLELVSNGRPKFWKIRGIELAGDAHKITFMDMGDGEKFLAILESFRLQHPTIHDIKIMFKSDLHRSMTEKEYSVNASNHSINVDFPLFDNNINIKILVYPQTTQIDVGCTYKPLIYDFSGVFYLHEILSKISYYLSGLSGYLSIPPVFDWIVTHYHFGKDVLDADGKAFHMTFQEVGHGLLRFYQKKMLDGSSITRAEEIRTPKRTMAEEIRSIL